MKMKYVYILRSYYLEENIQLNPVFIERTIVVAKNNEIISSFARTVFSNCVDISKEFMEIAMMRLLVMKLLVKSLLCQH